MSSKSQVRELQKMPVDRIMSAYFAVVKDMAEPGSDDAGLLADRGWKRCAATSVPSGGLTYLSRCPADAGLYAHRNDFV